MRDADDSTPDADETARLVNTLRDQRILISASGPGANVLKIRPPLVFSMANADRFLSAFEAALRR